MTNTLHQPTLPAEVDFTEAELTFMEESPPGLFPENQNSNFGYAIRKIFSDRMQEAIDQIDTLYTERFAVTSTMFLPQWERDYGLPVAPTGKTIAERRSMVQSRIHIGPFTRNRVNAIVEQYLNAAIGVPISLTPDGVPIVAGGIPLFGDYIPGTALYRVYEDIRGFAYTVWIVNTITPDVAGIVRELTRITPSGISFTVDNTRTNVLNYHRTVINKQPVAYYRLNANTTDESGYANNGTFNGGLLTTGAPGLLHASVQHDLAGNTDEAIDFDGSTNYITVNHAPQLNLGDNFSYEAWVRRDAATIGRIITKGLDSPTMYTSSSGLVVFEAYGTVDIAYSTVTLAVGTTYHVVITKDGSTARIWVNGVDRTNYLAPFTFVNNTTNVRIGIQGIGTSQKFNGVIDEIAIYNRALTATEILQNYNTGRNVA